jgi:dienelactone hydrolase
MDIREYLNREAQRITDRALGDTTDAAAWQRLLPERRRQYREMMGLLSDEPRPPVAETVTGVVERPRYRIEKLYYESLPQLYVTANLYIPNDLTAPAPGVIYQCGHADTQKVHYQAHARRFAELGFVCLIIDTIQLGEDRGYHHGCCREGWFDWYSRGYTPAGVEFYNSIRGLDLMAQRPEVDATRFGATGISGGGAGTWWIAAGDERVKVAAPVCGTSTLASYIYDRTIDGHCDCMWGINTYGWDLADIAALFAPRPLMIASADHDAIFNLKAIHAVHEQLKPLYAKLGAPENLRLITTPGPHSYHTLSCTAIFSWFLKHLQGKEVPPEEVGDVDESPEKQEAAETLRVYVSAPPPDNRISRIHEEFVPLARPPQIADRADLERQREAVIAALRTQTFAAFPTQPPSLDTEIEFEMFATGPNDCRFAYTSEEGWRLHGMLQTREGQSPPMTAVVALRSPGEKRWETEYFIGRLATPWAHVLIEPRGTGDTQWGEAMQWHLRRATAWTGRTLASLRVWDTLRALEAVRTLPQVAGSPLSLAARGEMAAVALYAALLDGQIQTLFLEAPPASQTEPSQKDGRGPAIEMLNCLRITDLPQVAGLLFPTELVFVGDCPATYTWAEELYRMLGASGKFRRISSLSEYTSGD